MRDGSRSRTTLQVNEVLLLDEVDAIVILSDELFDLVRVHIVAVNRVSIFVTGDIVHLVLVVGILGATVGLSEDACPLSMKKLTTLGFTDARVAEVGTLEGVTLGACRTLLTVAIYTKGATYRCTWRNFDMSISAAWVGAAVLHKM
jgi:hypothetical protein